MARLARRERNLHRLRIAHLADHNHVRRLPQRRAQRRWKIRRIDANLDLLDDALVMGVLVFDRIFNRDDVLRIARVDRVHQRRHGCGFSRSRRAAHEHQAMRQTGQLFHLCRKPQRRQVRRFGRQRANGHCRPAAFAMEIHAKAAQIGAPQRDVGRSS